MPRSNTAMIKKFQAAINEKFHEKLLYNKTQWYSDNQDRPVTTYVIRKAVWNEKKGKSIPQKLFSSTSQIQVVLFLRDYWYKMNGWEIPNDNEQWNKVKEKEGVSI